MNESVYYRATLDSLSQEALTELVNVADGLFLFFIDPWIIDALHRRGLVFDTSELFSQAARLEKNEWDLDPFTDYGRAFVAWYRQPRDVPIQLDLFGDEP